MAGLQSRVIMRCARVLLSAWHKQARRVHLEALHGGLQRADGVDLADDDARAGGLHRGRRALAHVTVAGHEHHLAAESRKTVGPQHCRSSWQADSAVQCQKMQQQLVARCISPTTTLECRPDTVLQVTAVLTLQAIQQSGPWPLLELQTLTLPAIITSVARMMPSGSEWRQPYTLSNLDLVTESLTLMAGNSSALLACEYGEQ